MCKTTIAFIFALIFLTIPAFAQPSQNSYVGRNKESLRGVEKIKLAIDYVLPGTEDLLPKDDYRALVEKQLEKRGITILREPFPPKSATVPTLHVVCSIANYPQDEDVVLYSISIEVSQQAILLRDSEIQIPTITWAQSFHGIAPADNLSQITRDTLRFLDLYAEDWKSVNKSNLEKTKQRSRLVKN